MEILGYLFCSLIGLVVNGKFFAISDLHYDIFYDGRFNETYRCHERKTNYDKGDKIPTDDVRIVVRENCDCSLEMISVALQQMKIVEPEPEFILVLGDIVGHFTSSYLNEDGEYNAEYTIKLIEQTHEDVVKLIRKFFPDTQIIPVIGNNDAYLDYVMPEGLEKKRYLEFLYKLWGPLVGGISDVFLQHGFYNTTTKSGKTILVLNSLLLSYYQENKNVGQIEQFLWLENEIVSKENIYIAFHIPPGMALYNGGTQSWKAEHVSIFKSILSRHSSKIKAIFTGHYHSGVFQLINNIPTLTSPSISPIFGGNPSFRQYDIENNNYFDYTLDSYKYTGAWYSTSFTQEYGFALNLEKLLLQMQFGLTSISHFLKVTTGWWIYKNPSFQDMCKPIFGNICNYPEEYLRRVAVCAIKYQLKAEFDECKLGLLRTTLHN